MLDELRKMQQKFEVAQCVKEYQIGGFEGLYKETLKDKKEGKKEAKKEEGKSFNVTQFEVGYIHSKIDHVTNLLNYIPFMESAEERKNIANELKNLANELESIK